MTSAADLFGLQEIDLGRDTRRALIADVDSRLGETEDLVAAREAVVTAAAALADLRRRQQAIEEQLEDLDAKIRPVEQKLYGGTVRNPKELTDLQREVDLFKRQRGKLDDEGLGNMEGIEAAEAAVREAKLACSQAEATWRVDQDELRETRGRAEHELARLEEERQRRVAGMDSQSLGIYEALRGVKQGRAVARIERGACQGCRLSLPTYVVQRARSAVALVQCPSCERILVGG